MYKPKDRRIFRYWDGVKERYADPIEIVRSITNIENLDIDADSIKAEQGDAESLGRILDGLRDILDIPHYTENDGEPEGLLNDEVLEVYKEFSNFVMAKKKDIEQKQS